MPEGKGRIPTLTGRVALAAEGTLFSPYSRVFAPAAVSGLYDKEILLNHEEFVAVDRPGRYSVERVAGVVVKQSVVLNRPAPGKFRDQFLVVHYFAIETTIALENVMTALDFVGVTPFARKLALSARLQDCTRRHQTEGERKHSFHASEGEHDQLPAQQAQSPAQDLCFLSADREARSALIG